MTDKILTTVSTMQQRELFIRGWNNMGIRVYNHIVKWINVTATAGFRAEELVAEGGLSRSSGIGKVRASGNNKHGLEDIMKIELLCTSCARCKNLYENTRKAIDESGKSVELVKVEDIPSIMKYGVMSMPALVIDGEVRLSGKVASVAEIKGLL